MSNPSPKQPPDDPSSAPESGTVRDETSGNNPTPPERCLPDRPKGTATGPAEDDSSVADEEHQGATAAAVR